MRFLCTSTCANVGNLKVHNVFTRYISEQSLAVGCGCLVLQNPVNGDTTMHEVNTLQKKKKKGCENEKLFKKKTCTMINKHKDICVGVYWRKLVFPTGSIHGNQCTVHGRVAHRTLWKKTDDLQLICLLLHVPIHRLVCCHDSLHLLLKFLAPTVNLIEMAKSSTIWRCFFRALVSQLRHLHSSVTIFIFSSFSIVTSSDSSSVKSAVWVSRTFWLSAPSNSGNPHPRTS